MKRLIDKLLIKWKNQDNRKPLLIHGARQVGKTHSIMEFGAKHYASVAYFYFDNNPQLCSIFESGISSIKSLLVKLSAFVNQEILPESTLMVFDEIQACPAALSSLKRFNETAENYHIIAAGSFLGVALRKEGSTFPVGKVDELSMQPLNFQEYLMEFNPPLLTLIRECFDENTTMPSGLHDQAIEHYLHYLVIGGMPEVVTEYIKTESFNIVKAKQLSICNNYVSDMNKHTDTKTQALRNEAIYNTLPSQLAKENRKFQYAKIQSGARAKDYELSLDWLQKASVILRCNKINEGKEPISAYTDFTSFKIYMSDVGLLNAKSNNSHLSVLGRTMGASAMGALTENYVAQQLHANGFELFYWESNNKAELDFVVQLENKIIPVEAKSWESVRSQSLEFFRRKYSIDFAIRISAKNFGFGNGIKNVPLYAVWCIDKGTWK